VSTVQRGRRSARTSGDERERAILETAERLLEERPLGEISVDDLARGAGISRPTFYFYFSSKDQVVLALLDRMVEQGARARDDALQRLAADEMAGWRESIAIFYETFGAHRSVVRAATELGATNPEARALWSQIMEGWVADAAARIEAERERGAAQPGVPARDLATALLQMNERAFIAIFTAEAPAVAEPEAIDTLAHIWLSAIYGRPA
jgi:TetR/AcrR family transcriptional regulator, ethionamide resistance regulator